MKKLILPFILVSSVFGKTFEFDQNSDGKADFHISYEGERIKSKKVDFNLDGKFDYIQTFHVEDFTFITKIDSNFDGVFELEKRAKIVGSKVVVKTYGLKGKTLEFKSEESVELLQAQVKDCVQRRDQTITFFENFTNSFAQILNHSRDDFTNIDFNLSIHKSCYKNFSSKDFNEHAKETVKRGMSCLATLASKHKNTPKRIELFNLLDMFKIHYESGAANTEIACGDESLKWEGVAAVGSTVPYKGYGEHQLNHPFVILNPNFKSGFWGGVKSGSYSFEDEEFRGRIFHEMIHNMGYTHDVGLDMAYACEGCCFSEGKLRDRNIVDDGNVACRLCAGDYGSNTDERYMEDLAKFEGDNKASFAFRHLVLSKNKKIDWNDRRLSSLLEYFFEYEGRFGKSLAGELLPLIKDETLKKKWKAKSDETWEGKPGEKLFNDSFAKFFKTFVVDGNEERAYKELINLKVGELLRSRVSSSMSMSDQRVDKSLAFLKGLLRQLGENAKHKELKDEISAFMKSKIFK